MVPVPRVGAEVIVQFLDGGPDRPIITGCVPNADNRQPWELPGNKTQVSPRATCPLRTSVARLRRPMGAAFA